MFILLFFCFLAGAVLAVTGTINNTNKYAWSNKAGWINFKAENGNVSITDTAITGYAWNEIYGWINLNPPDQGVKNTTAGALSGYAWGESAGWINFDGVTINCSGQFVGTATGDAIGSINFDCSNCTVSTNWQPSSGCGEIGGSGGGDPPTPSLFHNECNDSEQCVPVDGEGDDQCSENLDCGVTHNECSQNKCVVAFGEGADTCQKNSDCNFCDPHGDINKDGSINMTDFSILMYYWHDTPPANPCADINKDGTVDLTDFSVLLYWWTGQ